MTEAPQVRKRRRAVLVCTYCKSKKLKCNRQSPCDVCIKRGNKCVYATISEPIGESKDSPPVFDILNTTIEGVELMSVLHKPSKIKTTSLSLQGPTLKCILAVKDLFKPRREEWKSFHKRPVYTLSEVYLSDPDAASSIENDIKEHMTPNYFAVLERIRHFQVYLNKVVFDSCIPSDILFTIFHSHFKFKDHIFVFEPPQKDYQYQNLALLLSIVDLTITMTMNDPEVHFDYPMASNEDLLSHLALKCITYSRHDKKQTLMALYAIVAVRESLVCYGHNQNADFDERKAYPLYQKAICLAQDIGLHRLGSSIQYINFAKEDIISDLYYTSEIPEECLKRLWNYLLLLDAKYCFNVAPPYINYEYCHMNHYDRFDNGRQFEEYLKLSRTASDKLFSNETMTYNDLFNLCEDIKRLLETMVPFDNLQETKRFTSNWNALKFKMETLALLCTISAYGCKLSQNNFLRSNLSDEQLKNESNFTILSNYHSYMSQTFFNTYVLALRLISDFIDNKFPNVFYICMQNVFRQWFSTATIFAVDFMVLEDKLNANKEQVVHKPTTKMLEETLLGNLLNTMQKKAVVNYTTNSECIFEEFSQTHKKLFKLKCFENSYDFIILSIISWVIIYFVKSLLEVNKSPKMDIKEKTEKLIELTKYELQRHNDELQSYGMHTVPLVEFLKNDGDIDSILEAFFDEQYNDFSLLA